MPYALSNLANGQPPSWRAVDDTISLDPGEVLVDDIPDNPVWDTSLNGDTGGLRSMTDAEIEAATQAQADMQQTLKAATQAMQSGQALTTDQQTAVLEYLQRAVN